MAQYNITASSVEKEMTVSNTTVATRVDNEEGGRPTEGTKISHPSPSAFDTLELAQKNADNYAVHLNDHYHEGGMDWVGHATAV